MVCHKCMVIPNFFWLGKRIKRLLLPSTCRGAGKSQISDFTLSAKACLPIIDAVLAEVKSQSYPQRCFLNIDLPTNVANHKVTTNLLLQCQEQYGPQNFGLASLLVKARFWLICIHISISKKTVPAFTASFLSFWFASAHFIMCFWWWFLLSLVSCKGYKLTKQGKSIFKMGWRDVTSDTHGGKMLSTMTMETDMVGSAETDAQNVSADHRLFQREVCPFFHFTPRNYFHVYFVLWFLACHALIFFF